MRWRHFSVTTPQDASEAVCAILQELFNGLSISSVQGGALHEAYLSETKDVDAAELALREALTRIPDELACPDRITVAADWVEEQDWAEAWKEHYHPIRVTERLVVVPPWLPWPDPDSPVEAHPDDILIRIDPGMAFGTGVHATSRLCMMAIQEYMPDGAAVLDFGCGSGILTITACKLGAARVLAMDNDPVCIKVTNENVAASGVAERCETRLAATISGTDGKWDIVVANILMPIVANEAANAASLIRPDGHYIISGFTDRSEEELGEAVQEAGLTVVKAYAEAEWRCWVTARNA